MSQKMSHRKLVEFAKSLNAKPLAKDCCKYERELARIEKALLESPCKNGERVELYATQLAFSVGLYGNIGQLHRLVVKLVDRTTDETKDEATMLNDGTKMVHRST